MFAERDVAYEHVTDSKKMDLVFVGDECASTTSTNLAPPCIVDGDTVISQNIPVHVYVGKRLDFEPPTDCEPEVALQYMCDLEDLHTEMRRAHTVGQAGGDVVALKKYLTGARFASHLGAIERSIKGPFYFGERPTYVDFIAVGFFDMLSTIILDPVSAHTGIDFLASAPKLLGVLSGVRGLPSAEKLPKLPLVPPAFVMGAARAATWDEC